VIGGGRAIAPSPSRQDRDEPSGRTAAIGDGMRIAAVTLVTLSACTGMTLGENAPGGDTWVEPDPPEEGEHTMGAVAVERDGDLAWVVHEEALEGRVRSRLAAVDAATGAVVDVLDVSAASDRRVVFPSDDRVLVMAQRGDGEHLAVIDTATLAPVATAVKRAWYHGTRTSPSGRALVVADGTERDAPLHLIDTASLDHHEVEHGGDAIEAMWNRTDDRLLAVSVDGAFEDAPAARMVRFDLRDADLAAGWPEPELELVLPGYDWDSFFSFTWVGVSPDDRWAVFPLVHQASGEHELVLLDQVDGSWVTVPGRGPVGFTPDGSTIVSYGYGPESENQLWLIDPVTLETDVVPVPVEGLMHYFVTWDGNYVVLANVGGGELTIHDPATGETVQVQSEAPVALHDFVTRPGHEELWLESYGDVYRLDLATAELEEIRLPVDLDVTSIAIRPAADQILLGERDARIWRLAPAERAIDYTPIELPRPFADDGVGLPAL
jgi:DNA-binding beta-propeller fold protein YncE